MQLVLNMSNPGSPGRPANILKPKRLYVCSKLTEYLSSKSILGTGTLGLLLSGSNVNQRGL